MKVGKAAIAAVASTVLVAGPGAAGARSDAPLPCVLVPGVADRCPAWEATYRGDGGGTDAPREIALAPDGGTVYAVGFSEGGVTGLDGIALAYDAATGAVRWQKRYAAPEPVDGADEFYGLAAGPAGTRVYAVGSSCATLTDASGCDLIVVAYDAATGAIVWEDRVGDDGSDVGFTIAVTMDPDDGGESVFVAGRSELSDGDADFITISYDGATGDHRWTDSFDAAPDATDGASDLALSQDGSTLFVTGSSGGDEFAGTTGVSTIAYDASEGTVLWSQRHEARFDQMMPNRIAVGGGRVFVSAQAQDAVGSPASDLLAVAYDSRTGSELWRASYNSPVGGPDMPMGLAASVDGTSVVMTGMSRAASWDFATISYDPATGQQRWAVRYDGVSRNGDAPFDVQIDPTRDAVYILGSSYLEGPGYLHALVALDLDTGDPEWSTFHLGPGRFAGATPSALALDGTKGRAYVVGQVIEPPETQIDLLTIAYDLDAEGQTGAGLIR